MKIRFLLVFYRILIGFNLFYTVTAVGKDSPKLWIVTGFSNGSGKAPLPGFKPDPRVEMWKSDKWVTASDPLSFMDQKSKVGGWHATALEVASKGYDIRLIGGPLIWNKKKYSLSDINIKKSNQQGDLLIIFGGSRGVAEKHLSRMQKLVKNIRLAAKNPKMPLVMIQVGAYVGRKNMQTHMHVLREAQRQLVVEDGNAILLTAFGQGLIDFAHLSREGYSNLAKEIGRAILKNHYGHKDINWPGPILDCAVLENNNKTIWAHFAEVEKLSGCVAKDFGIKDTKGYLQCKSAITKGSLVRLEFSRKINLPADLIYGFGWAPKGTLIDEAGNHAPAVRLNITRGKKPTDTITRIPNGAGNK